jgi:hypothetical protein
MDQSAAMYDAARRFGGYQARESDRESWKAGWQAGWDAAQIAHPIRPAATPAPSLANGAMEPEKPVGAGV